MDIFEISGYRVGVDNSGVNFLDPTEAFESIENGYIYRQEILSRKGFSKFTDRLPSAPLDNTRVMGIFENVLPDATRQLLVIDQNYLYSYNTGTGSFDLIPNGSAGADVYPFSITNPEDYVSGTTYLKADGTQRFVFTGKGMSDIYFYDGIDVKRFTNAADNPNYQAPASGTLTAAKRIMWFGERLNLFGPIINGLTEQQGILYSGIRTTSGNGDKFNVAGSGQLNADTYEILKGAQILGDIVIINFQRSNWALEKTRDAFNPYFIRKIPSVLGTDADFSSVSWAYEVKSIGDTGLITTDGRQSLRFDDKIPYFTEDDIDPQEFELTYGGFDRINGQFLFSYRESGSNLSDTTQDKVLVYNYEEGSWSINDQRFSVFGQTDEGINLVWNDIDENENPSWLRWDTTEEIWNKIGLTASVQKTLAGDNDGFIYNLNKDNDDYFTTVSAITAADPAVATIGESAFKEGDQVVFENVEGMTQINGLLATVTSSTNTTITLDIDSTLFDAYTTAGSVSKYIDFKAKTTVFNPYRDKGRKCNISHIEVLINTDIGDLYVDVFEDEEETLFKTVLLETTTDARKKREWITVIINDEANFFNFVFRSKSVSNQKVISAIRIHASQGSLNAG